MNTMSAFRIGFAREGEETIDCWLARNEILHATGGVEQEEEIGHKQCRCYEQSTAHEQRQRGGEWLYDQIA